MRKTSNYQLNQWDAEDRILREDFNADNAKIDSSIADLRTYTVEHDFLVKIMDITTTAAASQVNLSLSGINWEKYGEVFLYVRMISTTDSQGVGTVKIRLNNDAGNIYQSGGSLHDYLLAPSFTVAGLGVSGRIPYGRVGMQVHWSGQMQGTEYQPFEIFSYLCPYGQPRSYFSTMNFIGTVPLAAGCRFVMMGVKL